ncbi:DNA-directed RNA polymerase III subunit RPC9 [Euwallacea similis]|uniref:DNA-directed RNA polymerase III subunit RPC9 n=1 Tax=Euwallacea similis TaxID=1736056 RepID=UPI00344B2D60
MEILNSNSATLSNFEVLRHLQKIKDSKKKQRGQLATITYETLRYLEETPCKSQTPEVIAKCLKALEPYNLHKTEKLMMINTPPTSLLELQVIVEETDERLTEEEMQQIFTILQEHFPGVFKNKEETGQEDDSS